MLVSSLKLSGGHNVCPVWSYSSIRRSKCPRGSEISAHDQPESLPTMVPESVPTLHRNECPRCAGIRTVVLLIPECPINEPKTAGFRGKIWRPRCLVGQVFGLSE